jgi:hypothetical protein
MKLRTATFFRSSCSEKKFRLQVEIHRSAGVVDPDGRTPLDIGVMHMDGATAAALLTDQAAFHERRGEIWRSL